ncbi:glycosyltransferase family 4 protein [Picosynechococcus sp. PCC 8807]|uniref:glycosyltransferase family 4 protein n=1 Tax=Picosynechococcus sp. PCC 8807 TaxID=195248 RepID=UPI000810697E|nr:glycosyltransferase family 4 protein [Picosynechococcus sp. PCC 8807]ANV90447.1 colanic acid biosynthesis glycosyltransferase WcaL [Picosynechococcus sp. PCC 8807]
MAIAYVVKRYPRYSETFIVNEILAHEAAGLDVRIFALRPPVDSHFQDKIARVKAPVTYIQKPSQGRSHPDLLGQNPTAASYLWAEIQATAALIPDLWEKLAYAAGERSSVLYQALWLAQAVRHQGITHLHAHFASVATSVTRLAAHFAGVPYSFTAHAKDIFHESVDPADFSRKLQDACAVVTVSDYNRAYLQQQYGEVATKVKRIYNGMDLTELPYQPPLENPQPPLIVSVSRLVEKKGLTYLIAACDLLRRWNCSFRCQIVGSGPLETTLRSQIAQHQLEPWVEITGPKPQGEVFQLLKQATVFAAPYVIGKDGNRDGLPTVLLEAIALGTPCVGTDVTGIPEIIAHQKTGLLVAQNDPEQLAKALQILLNQTDLRHHFAQAARQRLEQAFDLQRNAAQLRQLFHQGEAQR